LTGRAIQKVKRPRDRQRHPFSILGPPSRV
jgi:hypothetical protein